MVRFRCFYRKSMCFGKAACFLSLMTVLFAGQGFATPINLNDFYADSAVIVAADGFSAKITEDSYTPVLLSNDPGFGDPEVIIAGAGTILYFDYDFFEGSLDDYNNDDEFGAFVIDGDTGLSVGSAFEFYTEDASYGTIEFDLTSLVGKTLGLQFQLSAFTGDLGLTSYVDISNVRLETAAPVPEPGTLSLLVAGLIGLASVGRKRLTK